MLYHYPPIPGMRFRRSQGSLARSDGSGGTGRPIVTFTSCGAGKLEQVSERLAPPARRPSRSEDLLPSERQFAIAMAQLDFGRFESIRVRSGELILEPW